MIVGRLDPSAFAPSHEGDHRRLGAGLVATLVPNFLPNLEIGAGRFFHRRWPPGGLDFSTLGIPFEGFLKEGLTKDTVGPTADNQLASAFVRITLPGSSLETYGEVLRDDHNLDVRDFLAEPDHEMAFALGIRKGWVSASSGVATVLTIEGVNGRISHLARLRDESPMYVHIPIVEGHTLRGQVLGSPAAFGGSGFVIIVDRYARNAVWHGALRSEHVAQNGEGASWNGTQVGFTQLELSRTSLYQRVELTYGGAARVNWDSAQGARTNFTLGVSVGRGFSGRREDGGTGGPARARIGVQ
jgi:hypothetical protein